MTSIRLNQAENFKKNYLGEIKSIVSYFEQKIKNDENIEREEVEEATAIFTEALAKLEQLNK